ncbi:MAG: Ig-like domain-containing protein [Gemmatimonadota bacterium]|nr:Ig-like domain-containing protein [Gemmatimonadota bacterium]
MRSTNRYGDVRKPSSVRTAVRKRRIFLPVAAMLAGMIWGSGCGDGTEPPPSDPPRPATVTVTPATAQLAALGATVQLTAHVYDQDGQLMAGATVTWASGAPAVATVSSTGLVTATDNGTATVTASAGSASGAAEITVAQEVSSLIVSPDTATLQAIGDTLRLMAETTDANGHAVTSASVVWGSDDETVAAVDSSGLVRAMGEGTATVTASAGSASGAAEITVVPQADRIVLTTFYRETGGADWTNSRNWLSSEPLARWHGIEVDAEGRVIGLALSDNNVVGPIPPLVGDLSGLQYLHIDDNGLTGRLPPELARAERLNSLKINGNALSGAIPLSLSALSLRELHYNDTKLCVPDDDSFREWLRGIASHEGTGVECVSPTDREILLALYDATDGPNWKDNSGWLTEAPLREWHGVRAVRDGRVVDLSLFGNGLWGTLPPEIGGLSRLASLDLRANSLTGPIPTELGNLAELEYLLLGANALTGTIPSELGDLSALTALSLNTNQLTGRIPGELGNLVRLRSLVLDRNRLSGPLPPELGNLANLELLELSYNLLDGAVPVQLLQLGELTTLFLHANGGLCLPGTPRFVTWWSRIGQPRGSFCNAADASVLESFHHATNGPGWTNSDGWLGGQPLSAWHGVETDSLGRVRQLGLTDNGLEGTIGPELSELADLTELRIADNDLFGPVPLEFMQLELREFDYSGTELCTPPDPYFREWLNSIADHQGTGVECAPLSDRTVLEVFYEATDGDNWATNSGWMTNRPLGDWHGVNVDEEGRVTRLSLGSNNLAGRIPAELGHLTELGSLRLQDNALTGRTPAALGHLAKLVHLSLSFNDLRGGIPRELGNLTALTWLDIASNRGLGGSIPPDLGRLANLTELRLNNTGLTGRIPSELGNLSRLSVLSLYGNSLTGGIPPEFGNLSSLGVLALFDNVLTGPIPPELGRLAALEHFGAHRNALSGAIPPSLGGLAALKGLRLHSNRLSGRIPPEIGRLSRLTSLVLDRNELTGTIPREIGNLAALEVLYLARNTLTGGIPAELGSLTGLRNFDLSHNSGMRGTLPATVADLTRLDRMLLGGTQLCMPRTPALLEWLRGIERRRIALCGGEEGSIAYLTQAVQSHGFPVPLVAGEGALLRVFVKSGSAAGVSMPLVRARFYLDGTEVHVADIPGGPAAVPTEIVEGDLSMSANAEIPDSVIQPGLEMVVEIDPDSTLDPDLGITARIPPTGRSEVGVRAVPPFDLTVIPFLLASDPDSSLLDTTRGLNPESELLWDLNSLLPIADLEVDVHEPVSASSVHPYSVLDMTEAIRIMEGGDGYYLGLVPMSEPSSVRGVAFLGGRSQASKPIPSVIAHEAGHNLNLTHAPCGGAGGPDPSFPHRNGSIGAWGFDPRTNELVPPGTGALMSYCSPRWVSDYNFTNMVSYRVAAEEDGSAAIASPARSILLWGGVDAGLGLFLEPSLVIDAPAVMPRSGGPYRVTGTDADERELFSLNFDMPVVSDSDGRASFTFALPAPPEWAGVLANITLSGPAGSVTINRESNRPMAILLDAQSGRVRGILRDEAETVSSYADAEEAFSAGRRFKVLFSRGIPDATAWER